MPSSSKKPKKKPQPKDGPTPERIRKATVPNPRSKKTIAQRMREATAIFKPKKRRRAMTDQPQQGGGANQQTQPRGAGSGEAAVAYRSKVDDPVKQIPHQQAVDELEAERDAQAEFNAEQHEAQVEQANAFNEKMAEMENSRLTDAEQARDDARKQFAAQNDPKAKEANIKAQQKFRAEREKAAASK